jgi:transposase
MLIIGCDYHPSVQQIALIDTETGEYSEHRPQHSEGEAEKLYRDLKLKGMSVRVGLEATGHTRWFEQLLAELGYELWIGDAAQITAMRVRKQKTDRQDAAFLLKLLLEDRFPRVWVPSPENRDLRQLLWHRHRLVQMRTRVMNQRQSAAMSEGLQRRGGLGSKPKRERLELLPLPLVAWANRRRQDLLTLLDRLNESVEDLTAAVQQEAEQLPEARLLMTHPGVGPVTALAFILIIGSPERFQCGKQIGSYVGLIPEEASSGVHRRLGHISKQGSLLRFLLVEAAKAAARFNPEWCNRFLHLAMRRERRIAKVAMARKLPVSLYWMWRKQQSFQPSVEVGSYAE